MKVNLPKTQLFCNLYWQKLAREGVIQNSNITHVANHHGLSYYNDMLCCTTGISVRYDASKVIRKADIEFLCLKPIEKAIVLWRGLADLYSSSVATAYFNKSLHLKKGDKIRLPGYIYATPEKEYAEFCAFNKHGASIVYKINVLKGARISRDGDYVFPRNSEFICTDSRAIKGGTQPYKLISLDYIKPEDKVSKL